MRSAMLEYIDRHQQDQFRLLRELVLQPSYTGNKRGVDTLGDIIGRELAQLPLNCSISRQSTMGNHLVFRSRACNDNSRQLLLVGHMDTVFPPESGFDWYREESNRVFGPGVIDMKGGLVTIIFVLKALQACDLLSKIPITFICNSDEEGGSPTSTGLIDAEARRSILGMVFECGGLAGELVTGRKGKSGFTLKVQGKAGHAAFSGSEKASAILALAKKIVAIEQLNDPQRQLVVNVGVVSGGIGANTIAEHASAMIDTRYLTGADGRRCAEALQRIADTCDLAETSSLLEKTSSREPMEQTPKNRALYKHICREAEIFSLPVLPELRSGVSDANVIAAAGTPVIDGMGPIGDCDHSDKEYMVRDSLPARTRLAAASIVSMWSAHTQGALAL